MLNQLDGKSMIFEPSFLKINVGDKVTFIPEQLGHNSASLLIPKNSKPWKSQTNQRFSLDFNQQGIYIYECSIHGVMAMIGIIQVGEAKNLEEAKDFLNKHRNKVIMNKNRIDDYLKKLATN